ncbi:MAG: sigma 54 modulation/S30EA ribosomal C-terminal domain-containing protein [Hyphomonadaceae bacterium]|nr:sigma 54 modulation/S30EA ribosomal C-terminal domain-containing protein [Hyphomonadaceae bacterium]
MRDSDNDDGEDDSISPAEPMVIAEKPGRIETMTPSMAALELGLADAGVVIFNNAKHGGLNVVFKRSDGNIGWIAPY